MAAVYGYDEQYVDEMMDCDRLFYHLNYYYDNPPAGTILKMFFEALGKKGDGTHSDNWTGDGGQPRPKSFKNDEERLRWEENQLNALIRAMGGSGGVVRKKEGSDTNGRDK